MFVSLIRAVGETAVSFAVYVGDVVMLAVETIGAAFAQKIRWRLFLQQIVEIGLRSQVVVMITGAFTGAVFAAQTYFQFNKLGMGSAVGAVVSVSICRELGPVLTALMVTGRVGASMSAEIGTMKVTEQIDALRALAVHPIDYLVVPRTLAMMVSMPLLVAEAVAIGIAAGYFVAIFLLVIIGRSGGGKSVLLKHLVGLMTPDAGEIWIDGESIIGLSERKLAPIRLKVGILFQGGALFDSMTVQENIAFPLEEAGERDPKKIAEKVREILEVIELEGEEEKMPVNLSGGMRKRVGLARSIIRRPSCVLYDEPTAGLDPVVSDSINRLIRRLQKRFGVTSIVVTHDMKSAFHIADHIAYLHEGRIYFYGTPQELEVSTDPLIQDLMLGRSEDESGRKSG